MSKAIAIFTSLIIVFSASLAFGQVLPERYHTYQEVLDTLTDLRDSFPEILYLDTLGFSTRDNIPMLRVKISDNPQIDEDEPAIFLNGGVHADEVLGVEVVTNFIQDITARYSEGDPEIIDYIERLEIFCIPFVNPEGHLVVEAGQTDWRKNKSDNDTNGVFDMYDGVDNNRNYDFAWDIDDNNDANHPESLQFKGWAPFTESENIAIAAFGWKYRPIIGIDYHSPTYGRPNVAYYPWYWYPNEGGHGFGPDESLMQSICYQFCNRILAVPDTTGNPNGNYEARRALVNKGDFKTYFYGNFGTAAFSCEVSDTTIQDPALVDSIVTEHLDGQYYLLDRALGAGITGVIRDSVTLEPIEAEVQVTQHINDDINPRLSRPDFGRYHRLLANGTYTLRFLKDDYRTKTVYSVSVNSNGPTTTNILLYPYNPRPPAPELTFPVFGDSLDTNIFVFEWTEPVYAESYLLEVSTDSEFETFAILDSTLDDNSYAIFSPLEEGDYYWRVRPYNADGWGPYSEAFEFTIDLETDVDTFVEVLPSGYRLFQNYPNPFNATTRISFQVPVSSQVRIEIFDIRGALVEILTDNRYSAGTHNIIWDGLDADGKPLASGVYLYKLTAGDVSSVKRLMMLK
ncbi:MAG: T9SS type A sorting domain-containing protein [candidate division Zixibacteria bacterium]|nr:T9SS type A sorting domain-containing protein [candidate division Zixibacteria bacterium]